MNLWEIVDPNAEIVKSLSEHRDNPMIALVETSTRFNIPLDEVVQIYRSHLSINESKKKIVELQSPPKELRNYKTSGVEGYISNWKNDIDDLLIKHGYKLLGKGSFGRVYKNDKQNKVLKVFIEDKMFLEWIKFCQANPNNPWLPKFKSKLIRLKDKPPVYAIQIEELEPFKGQHKDLNSSLHYVLTFMATNYDTLFKDGKFDPDNSQHSDFVMKGYAPVIERIYDKELDTVLQFLFNHRDEIDLDANNLMFRGNQPVLMDPLAA